MNYGIIYKITNLVNGKIYIGLTTQELKKRWKAHIRYSKTNKTLLSFAINKYSHSNFKIEEIDTANSQEELNQKEIYWIAFHNSNDANVGYNLSPGGYSGLPRSKDKEITVVNDYLSNFKISDIILRNNITSQNIYEILNKYGIKKRRGNMRNLNKKEIFEIVVLYKRKELIKNIALKFKVTPETIQNVLRVHCKNYTNKRLTKEKELKIIDLLKNTNESFLSISKKAKVSAGTVRNIAKKLGIKHNKYPHKLSKIIIDKAIELYGLNFNITEISKKLKVSRGVLRKYLILNGVMTKRKINKKNIVDEETAKRIISHYNETKNREDTIALFNISQSYFYKILKIYKEEIHKNG